MKHNWKIDTDTAMIASILDPRSKKLKFISESTYTKTKLALQSLYTDFQNQQDTLSKTPTTSQYDQPTSIFEETFLSNSFSSLNNIEEIERYLALTEAKYDSNLLLWWYAHKDEYSVLAKMARKYLTIPATSTSSERLFSDAGNIMTSKRTSLNPMLFERILFLKRNLEFLGGMFKKEQINL